jgi:heat shock protein HtpX
MYRNISRNKWNTALILFIFLALFSGLGVFFYYYTGTIAFLIGAISFAVVYTLIQYFNAAKIALAISGAKLADPSEYRELYNAIENIVITTGTPMPKVYIIQDPAPNAFATGRNPKDGHIAVTTGLLEIMDKRELEGVLAHEISHIRNYDILVSTIVFGIVSVISILCDFFLRIAFFGNNRNSRNNNNAALLIVGLVAVILMPIVAALIQLAISRQREYLADASGALAMRDPEGLAQALEKLETASKPMIKQNTSISHFFIVNPLKKGKFFSKMFSTHPPLEERVQRLRESESRF